MLLQVSFTPAKDKEADAIADAVKREPTVLRVERTGRQFVAASLCNGGIEIQVDSVAEAEAILRDLCFQAEENRLMPP